MHERIAVLVRCDVLHQPATAMYEREVKEMRCHIRGFRKAPHHSLIHHGPFGWQGTVFVRATHLLEREATRGQENLIKHLIIRSLFHFQFNRTIAALLFLKNVGPQSGTCVSIFISRTRCFWFARVPASVAAVHGQLFYPGARGSKATKATSG